MRLGKACLSIAAFALPAVAYAEDGPAPIIVTGLGLQDSAATPAYDMTTLDAEQLASSASGRIEDDLTPGRLVLTSGARADRWAIAQGTFVAFNAAGAATANNAFPDRSDWEASLRAGAPLDPGGGLKLRAAAYLGFRILTLNELCRPFTVFPVTTNANAALESEELRGFEAGFEWSPGPAVAISLTAFDDRVSNAIANVTVASNTRQRLNVDAVHARGIETGLRIVLGAVRFDASLALTGAKAEASGPSAALNGQRPAQTPGIAASATVGWRPAPGWNLALTARHTGKQFEDDLEIDPLPAATTLSAFAEVPLTHRFSLVLRGENLTDDTVLTRNQASSIDLGAPRTLWAGIRVSLL